MQFAGGAGGEAAGGNHGTSLCARQHKSPSATDDFGNPTSVAQGLLPCRTRALLRAMALRMRRLVRRDDGVNKSQSAGGFLARPHPRSGWCAGVLVGLWDPAVAFVPLLSYFTRSPYSWCNGPLEHWSI